MKEIEQMEAGKIYLIESTASANSVYFETDNLAKLFFRYCDYYLRDYLQVKEYVLNKNGWAMLIKVRSTQTIRKYYESVESTRKSKEVNQEQNAKKSIWWILSERVRLFISTYVRMSNKVLGRAGSLVRRKYRRYQFDNLEEAQHYIATIRNNKHELEQAKAKYRGFKEHFRMRGNITTNPLRSSLWVEIFTAKKDVQGKLMKTFGDKLPILQGLGSLVALNQTIDKSASKHPQPKPPKT